MKKMIAILLVVLLAFSGVAMATQVKGQKDLSTDTNLKPGQEQTQEIGQTNDNDEQNEDADEPAEETEDDFILVEGFLLEKNDGYILMETSYGEELQVNLSEDVAFMAEDLMIGDYIYVVYNGMMTRSLPAQISALSLGCDKLTGVVEEMSEEGFMLRVETVIEGEEGAEPEIVTESYFVTGNAALVEGLLVDMPVTVYHDGKVTRSIPPQVSASYVRLMELEGVIDETTEEGFLMTDVNGMQYRVALTEDARLFVTPAAGTAVRVVYNGVATMSIPALINGTEVLPVPVVEEELATVTIVD